MKSQIRIAFVWVVLCSIFLTPAVPPCSAYPSNSGADTDRGANTAGRSSSNCHGSTCRLEK